jgi:hypothetical protein
METIKLRSRTDQNGILHLDIPVAILDTELEVTVTLSPITPPQVGEANLGWSEGFFERTAGKWLGEPLVRGDQGEYPLI